MRKTVLKEVYKLAKKDKRVVFVGSDLGSGVLNDFKKEMPDRFFMEGVSEQHLAGFLAGLALNGKIPYFNTIAVFLTRRCYEQVFIDIAMHNLNVRLIGSGGGFVYAPLGPTHLAIDDISLMRTIPNMTILAPADAVEMAKLIPQTLDYKGPIYIRLAKGGDPIVTEGLPCAIGKSVLVKKGKDILILTTGITLQIALNALPKLQKLGYAPTILHNPTIKPLDSKSILKYAKNCSLILSIEEGFVSGGMGSAVSQLFTKTPSVAKLKLRLIGVPDVFPNKYGSQNDLLSYYQITAERIVSEVKKELRKKM